MIDSNPKVRYIRVLRFVQYTGLEICTILKSTLIIVFLAKSLTLHCKVESHLMIDSNPRLGTFGPPSCMRVCVHVLYIGVHKLIYTYMWGGVCEGNVEWQKDSQRDRDAKRKAPTCKCLDIMETLLQWSRLLSKGWETIGTLSHQPSHFLTCTSRCLQR